MSTALVTGGSSCIIFGPRSPHIHELPAETEMISCIVCSDRPAVSATFIASAAAAMCTPHKSWLIIFAVEPRPAVRPTWKMRFAVACMTGSARSSSAFGPEHMMVSAPSRAPTTPPDTGASSIASPASARRAAKRAACAGGCVHAATTRAPRGKACAAPP